jgi:hypothetical protein
MVRVDPDAPGRVVRPPPRVTAANTKETRPGAPVREQTAFYDLTRYAKYNDSLLVTGFIVIVVGVSLMHVPSAVVLLGAGAMKLAWMMGQGK